MTMERQPAMRLVAKYLVRAGPYEQQILEIEADRRGNLYTKYIASGWLNEMLELWHQRYGEDYVPPVQALDYKQRSFGVSPARQANNRPYSDLDFKS